MLRNKQDRTLYLAKGNKGGLYTDRSDNYNVMRFATERSALKNLQKMSKKRPWLNEIFEIAINI